MQYQKNPRLKHYDYSDNGYYFITNNTHYSKPYIKDTFKKIIKDELLDLERRFKGLRIYYYSIMPTHIHVLLELSDSTTTIPQIWRTYKSITTVKARKNGFQDAHLWQLNYFEHIVRSEQSLLKIVEYVRNNPFRENIPFYEIYGDRLPNIK